MALLEVVGLTVRYGSVTAVSGVDLRIEILGLPAKDIPAFVGWTTAMNRAAGAGDQEANQVAGRALLRYVDEQVTKARGTDADHLIGVVANAEINGQPMVLDEPVNGLDPEGMLWIRHLLKALADEGRTVFISSHLMSEMALTAQHLIIVGQGRLIADTTVDGFIAQASGNVTRVRSPQAHALSASPLRVTQARVVLSEWTKFRSLRSTVITLAVAVVISLVFALVTGSNYATMSPADKHSFNAASTSGGCGRAASPATR
jgi:hypothetical protein